MCDEEASYQTGASESFMRASREELEPKERIPQPTFDRAPVGRIDNRMRGEGTYPVANHSAKWREGLVMLTTVRRNFKPVHGRWLLA